MAALPLTTAQASIVTAVDAFLETVFSSGAEDPSLSTIVSATTGYTDNQLMGLGVTARANANRAAMRKVFQQTTAAIVKAANLGGSSGIDMTVSFKNADFTLSNEQFVIATGAVDVNVALPPAASVPGKVCWFRSKTAGATGILITPDGSDTINGNPTYYITLTNWTPAIISDGVSDWLIFPGP